MRNTLLSALLVLLVPALSPAQDETAPLQDTTSTPEAVSASHLLQQAQSELEELEEQIAREEARLARIQSQLVALRRQHAMLSSAESAFLLGEELYLSGSIVWARDAFRSVIDNFPESVYYDEALFRLELISFELQDYEGALTYYDSLSAVAPGFPNLDLAQIAAGLSAYNMSEFGRARQLYDLVSPAGQYGALAEYLRAVAYVEEGDREAARSTLEGILGGSGAEGADTGLMDRVRIALAQLQVDEGDFDAAVQSYSRVSPFSPYYDVAMLGKVWTFMRQGRYQEAYNLAERVRQEVPASDLISEFELAMANCALGAEDLEMAVTMYEDLLDQYMDVSDSYDLFLSGDSLTYEEFDQERERLDRIRIGLAELKQEAYTQGDLELVELIEEEEEALRQLFVEISSLEAALALPVELDSETMEQELTRLIQVSRSNTEMLAVSVDEVHALAQEQGTTQDVEDVEEIDEEVERIRLALQDLSTKFEGGMTRGHDWVQETQYGIAVATYMERELKRDSLDYLGAYYRNRMQEALDGGDSVTAARLDSMRSREITALNERIDEAAIVSAGYFEDYLATYPESRFTPDVLVRLAQLYYDIDNLAHSQQQAAVAGEEYIPEDYTRSIELYERVLNNHPGSEVEDVALYSLGYCLEAMMDFDGAVESYKEVLERFPESDLAAECNIRVGNYYFDMLDYSNAETYFDRILDYPNTSPNLYQHGLYKLGWTLYLNKDFDRSIAVFSYLLQDDRNIEDIGIERRGDIRILDESMEYMAYAFLEMTESPSQRVPVAVDYLHTLESDTTTVGVLNHMAEISSELTDWMTAIDAYEALLAEDPMSDQAPVYQVQIAQAYEEMGEYGLAAAARDELVTQYGEDSEWASAVGSDEALATADSLRGSSFEQAIQYYLEQTVTAEGDPVAYAAANEALVERINTYLDEYGNTSRAYEYRFHLGDAYYHLGEYVSAGETYYQVARDSTSFQRQEVALNNAFSSYLTAYEDVPGVDSTYVRGRLLEVVNTYVDEYPDGDNVAWFLWAAAPKYFNAGEYETSRELFGRIYEDYPNSGYAARSAKFIADSYQLQESYAEAEEWYGMASEMAAVTGEDLGADIEYLAASSAYNDAAMLAESENTEDLLAAAQRWEETAHQHPGSEVAPVALYDAADTYGRAGDIDSAVRLFRELATLYPENQSASQGLLRAAYLLREDERYLDAAEMYLEAYNTFPTAEGMVAALSSAANSYELAGREDLSITVYEQIAADRAGTPAVVTEAYAKIGEYNYEMGNYSIARTNYQNALQVYDQYREADITYPAMAAYHLGEITAADYYAVTPVNTENVEYKTQLFNEAVASYNQTFTYLDNEYFFRAVLGIGELQEDFANAIGFMDPPEDLDPEGEEGFYQVLMEAYDTYIGRAISTYENGLQVAMNNGIKNEITDSIAEHLDLLSPGASSGMGYTPTGGMEAPPADTTGTGGPPAEDEGFATGEDDAGAPEDVEEGFADDGTDEPGEPADGDAAEGAAGEPTETDGPETPDEQDGGGGGCFLWPF